MKLLCRAAGCVYVNACGGYTDRNLGAEYIKELCRCLFGIPNFYQTSAAGLDIEGADTLRIMAQAKEKIRKLVQRQKKKQKDRVKHNQMTVNGGER